MEALQATVTNLGGFSSFVGIIWVVIQIADYFTKD